MRALLLLGATTSSAAELLCHEAAGRAASALRAKGHDVDLRDLHAEGFRSAMTAEERAAYHSDEPILDPLVRDHAALVGRAETLLFVYPTMLSTVPPILKAWMERVLVPGVGFFFDEHNKVRPGLGHVRRIVGMSTYAETRSEVRRTRDNGRRTITRAIRVGAGLRTRTGWVPLYSVGTASDQQRQAFLERCASTAC